MRRTFARWLPLTVVALGAAVAWGLAQGRPPAAASPAFLEPPPIPIVELAPTRHRVTLWTHGAVDPQGEIALVAETPGKVLEIAPGLAAGSFVASGSLLVVLDPRDALLALKRAEAVAARAASEARLAAARLARQRSLAASDATSSARLEEAEHAVTSARARRDDAIAAREQARLELDRTRVTVPFPGRVLAKTVEVGQFVARGSELARVYAVDHAEIRLPIPVAELRFLDLPDASGGIAGEPGPRVRLRAEAAFPGVSWEGRIVRIEGVLDAGTRMLHVVARIDDPYGRADNADRPALVAGLFVEAEIEGRILDRVFVLPNASLRGADQVLVVDRDGVLRARAVEVLRREPDVVIVGEGLRAGEQVAALPGLEAGRRVTPRATTPALAAESSVSLPSRSGSRAGWETL